MLHSCILHNAVLLKIIDNDLCGITQHCTAAVLTGTSIAITEPFGLNSHSQLSRMIKEFPANSAPH